MIRVKICGINSETAFDAAVDAGADWVGFVFFRNSPRFVTPQAASALSARFEGGPGRVGLFVDPTDDDIAAALAALRLDALQIYAASERVRAIREAFGIPVWHSVSVTDSRDLPLSAGAAETILIEPCPPAGASRPGGNARTLPWTMLDHWRPGFPWMLAGGLTPANVGRAIAESGARAVDVSSGVETAPGVKSPDLIQAFVHAARNSVRG